MVVVCCRCTQHQSQAWPQMRVEAWWQPQAQTPLPVSGMQPVHSVHMYLGPTGQIRCRKAQYVGFVCIDLPIACQLLSSHYDSGARPQGGREPSAGFPPVCQLLTSEASGRRVLQADWSWLVSLSLSSSSCPKPSFNAVGGQGQCQCQCHRSHKLHFRLVGTGLDRTATSAA